VQAAKILVVQKEYERLRMLSEEQKTVVREMGDGMRKLGQEVLKGVGDEKKIDAKKKILNKFSF
jgi:hypothetical protein